jgi:glycosyltransferase involved in cell wall biosynthesis
VVHLHLPQLDASYIALLSRLLKKPVVLTYQCDLRLPEGLIHFIANQASHLANHISFSLADEVVVTSLDYAEASPFLCPYMPKIRAILPPAELMTPNQKDIEAFQLKARLEPGERIIGMAARLAAEKGVEYLVKLCPKFYKNIPPREHIWGNIRMMGEEEYAHSLPNDQELVSTDFLGSLSPAEVCIYQLCGQPSTSINSTEAFALYR